MTTFQELGVSEEVIRSMKKMGWTEPTPVQVAAIPVGLEGKDLFAQAQTGTGKTGTYGSIILGRVGSGYRTPSAVIIVPTRELALQVSEEMAKLSAYTGHVCMPVYGGVNIDNQAKQLRAGADIVICTPGRAKDMLVKQAFHVSKVSIVVLDEADRMLDMGFAKDLDFIMSKMPRKRQTMLFSATMPDEVKNLALSKMRDPEELLISKDEIVLDLTRQYYFETDRDTRKDALCTILDKERRKTIVFCQTKRRATQLSRKMTNSGYRVGLLHGDVPQNKREKTIRSFKDGGTNVLIATDVAARGLDIDDVGFVVNYDMTDPETYIHRIGRTGRAGTTGTAITFVLPGELRDMQRIERITGKPVERIEIDVVRKEPVEGAVNAQKSNDASKPKSDTKKKFEPREKPVKAKEKKRNFSKISVDIGTDDGIDKQDLCGFIKQSSGVEGVKVGRILMGTKMTYVEIDPAEADKVCRCMSEYDLDGKPIHAKRCEQ